MVESVNTLNVSFSFPVICLFGFLGHWTHKQTKIYRGKVLCLFWCRSHWILNSAFNVNTFFKNSFAKDEAAPLTVVYLWHGIAVCLDRHVPVASDAWHVLVLVKGLGALIGTPSVAPATDVAGSGERVHQILSWPELCRAHCSRKRFWTRALQELIDSIRQTWRYSTLIVRQVGARFELIAGERRWRAAQGKSALPLRLR